MRRLVLLIILLVNSALADGPYPTFSGLSAAADDAAVAATNPAAMTLFSERSTRFELLGFASDSSWEGRLEPDGPTTAMQSDSSTMVPVGAVVIPFRDNAWVGFTVLGSGFSEEYDDDWAGRYLLQEYELIYVSAYPSIATRLTDRWSVAASLALTYTTYEQRKAVPNIDPGYGDGSLAVDTDGLSLGYGLSALYELNSRSRLGFNYRSEIEPSLDGQAKFSGLGPITEDLLERAGLIGARIDVSSRQPRSFSLGLYHDLPNQHTLTLDGAWIDFSRFKLAEVFVEGEQIVSNEQDFDDALALSASYSWPINDRTRLGVGGFFVSDFVGQANRTMAFRMDDIWSVGFGVKWRWRENRVINASLNYLTVGDAPVSSPVIPGLGQVVGRYTSRDTFYFRASISFGPGGG